jgi:hypothetical protein
MRLKRTGRFGLTLIAVGVVTLACWTLWFCTRSWRPVDIPVSLAQGSHFSTGEFSINLNAKYALEIDSENKISSDALGCLLGNGIRLDCSVPSVVRVRWVLLSTDGTVVQGTSDDTMGDGGSGPSGEASRTIGYFRAQKGRRYKLAFEVLADGSALAVTNPRLKVSALNSSFESGLVMTGLLQLICVIIALVGTALLVSSVLAQSRVSRP